MSEVIDIMALDEAKLPYFDVNNTVESVSIFFPAPPYIARNAFGKSVFQAGDSFRMLSAGIVMPESFIFFKDGTMNPFPVLILYPIGNVSGHNFFNPNWQNGNQYIPMENYEMIFDNFLSCRETIDSIDPTKTLNDEAFKLALNLGSNYKISMAGVPSALNGKRYYIRVFIKLLHNFVLS